LISNRASWRSLTVRCAFLAAPPPVPISGSAPKWESHPKPHSVLELLRHEHPAVPIPGTMGLRRTPIPPPPFQHKCFCCNHFSPFSRAPIPMVPRVLLSPTPAPQFHGRPADATARNDGQEAGGVSMNLGLETGVQRLSAAAQRSPFDAHPADHLSGAGFPHPQTKVAAINVDTAGREVPLSGQKGICVQWR
jgi:hypothetical protein